MSSDECSTPTESSPALGPARTFDYSPFADDEIVPIELPASCSAADSWVSVTRRARAAKKKNEPPVLQILTGVTSVGFQPDFIVFGVRAGCLVSPTPIQLAFLHEHRDRIDKEKE